MGMNIHIHAGSSDLPLSNPPESLSGHYTLPRYVGSYEFMRLVYDDCDSISTCGCGETHNYFCDLACIHRPRDLKTLRERAKDLGQAFQLLIDYLESEPNAYLEYD